MDITKQNEMTRIHLNTEAAAELTQHLNQLLADYQLYYQNLRGLHWNIKGEHFFTLHEKFEDLYDDAAETIDMVAERILTLQGVPLHTYSDYISTSEIQPAKNISKDRTAVETVLQNSQHIIARLRQIAARADELEDDGTNDMMVEILRKLEKDTWMLASWLG